MESGGKPKFTQCVVHRYAHSGPHADVPLVHSNFSLAGKTAEHIVESLERSEKGQDVFRKFVVYILLRGEKKRGMDRSKWTGEVIVLKRAMVGGSFVNMRAKDRAPALKAIRS